MTWETDWKNWRRGRPSSPEIEIAIPDKRFCCKLFFNLFYILLSNCHLIVFIQLPVTTEKMTRPRMLVELLQEPFIFQLSLGGGATWTQIKLSICRTLIIEKLMEHQCRFSFLLNKRIEVGSSIATLPSVPIPCTSTSASMFSIFDLTRGSRSATKVGSSIATLPSVPNTIPCTSTSASMFSIFYLTRGSRRAPEVGSSIATLPG